MSQEERRDVASQEFGDNYNRLIDAVRSACPDIADQLPPPVKF